MSAEAHPIFCIVPPYMMRKIIDRGTPDQREWAIKTMRITAQMRDERDQIAVGSKKVIAKAATPGEQRVVYDGQQSGTLPGLVVRRESDPPVADPSVNEAFDGAGSTYDFYLQTYQRNSIDNHGMRIDSTVHYLKSFDNAFWNGEQMVYGDGDEDLPVNQRLFNRFTAALDVIGHELTHGVMQYEAALEYSGQSGALNESFSDVFGSLVKQYTRHQSAAQADWIIGEGLFTTNVNGQGVRSMKAPGSAYDDPVLGKDPQPATMSGYVNTTEDNGGVHVNCGIPNHAFYVAAFELGGNAWETAGHIWYSAMQKRLPANATFQVAANTLVTIAGELYGVNSREQQAVKKGWSEVGITAVNSGGENNGGGSSQPAGCLTSFLHLFRSRSS